MPPRHGGAPPGPSSGPQAASPVDRLFPVLLDAAVKLKPSIANLDPDALRRSFHNAWLSRPPPPNDLHAASALLVSVANRLARAARHAEDPFESAASSPAPSVSPASQRSPAPAGDLTLPHIDPQDVAAAAPAFPAVIPPSTRSLLEALLAKDQDDFRALDEAAISLLRDLAAKLAIFVSPPAPPAVDRASSPRSGFVPAPLVPKDSVAVQPTDPITKPASPPPRPPCSPTRPAPRASKPPPARKATPAKQSYAKATASAPAAPATAPAPPKAPASPPSKTAALRKSCIKQGTKAMKVIVRFPPSAKQPSIHQLWGMLAAFKPIDISITLWGDFILTFSQVLDSSDHDVFVKKFKKVYSVDVQVLNRGTTSLLKFPLVPTRHPDGSAVTSKWLHKTITGHPKWQDVEFVQTPRFIVPAGKSISYTATVFAEVADDRGASTAKRLLQTDVLFHTVPRRCKPWSVSMAVKQCGICLRWGHSTHHCSSKSAWCLACAGNHESSTHAAAVKAEPRYDTIKCANCHGKHWATARTCPFYKAWFNKSELASLQKHRLERVRETRHHRPRVHKFQQFDDAPSDFGDAPSDDGLY